jgi:uncharacterized protein YqjF (DUF2071 family)
MKHALTKRATTVLQTFNLPAFSADSWLMVVRESNLLFASWPLPVGEIRQHVPSALEVGVHDGSAWVTVEALEMEVLQFRNMPPLPRPIRGVQVNVRTYVHHQGQAGIYFLSLDCPGVIGTALSRLFFNLPFHSANVTLRLNGNNYHVESTRVRRSGALARFAAAAQIVGSPSPLEAESLPVESAVAVRSQTERRSVPWTSGAS